MLLLQQRRYAIDRTCSGGPTLMNGNVRAAIREPYNTSQTPRLANLTLDNGLQKGQRPTVPLFASGQRDPRLHQIFKRSNEQPPLIGEKTTSSSYFPAAPASLHLHRVKANAVGKSTYKIGMADEAYLSTKEIKGGGNVVRRALRTARSGGCVVPKKCGPVLLFQI